MNIIERLTTAQEILLLNKKIRIKSRIHADHIANGCKRCNAMPPQECEYATNVEASRHQDNIRLLELKKKVEQHRRLKDAWRVTDAVEGRR